MLRKAPLSAGGAASWAMACQARSGNCIGCRHLLRRHRIYDEEPPELRTPGQFYSTSLRWVAVAGV